MSFFLLYFECRRPASVNYSGFADVGKFYLPREIWAGNTPIIFEGRRYVSGVVADHSKQSENNFFLKGGEGLKGELIAFIKGRMATDCVVSNLVGHIEDNAETTPVVKSLKTVGIDYLNTSFELNLFRSGFGVQVLF